MSLYNTYNNEDIISRAVIAGMLGVLNNNIEYTQVWDNENKEIVKVPWFYNQSGDERFMQDFYTHYAECAFPEPKKVDGNFDQIPRGVITYTGSNIDSDRITNRFVQGRYSKEIDGKLQTYVSFLYSIPLTVNFDCELWVDSQVTALKIEQQIRQIFFKTVTFYVYFKGMRLGCTSGFSDDMQTDKLIDYSFEDDNRIKLNFNIEVETYQPVFDPTTEMDANNNMKKLGYNMYSGEEKTGGVINISNPQSDETISKDTPVRLEWNYTGEGGEMNAVSIYWLEPNSNEWNLIEAGIPNHQSWDWYVPSSFTNYEQPTIIFEETSLVSISRHPEIIIIPKEGTKEILPESFSFTYDGYFMAPSPDSSIGIILEMKDDEGRVTYSGDNDIYLNIVNYKIAEVNPVWVDPSINLVFPGVVERKKINIHVANATDKNSFGIAKDITIV